MLKKRIKVGLNGFGRIGRAFARIALEKDLFDLSLINTRKSRPEMMAYLLKYDSVYRKYGQEVRADMDGIVVGGKKIPTLNNADIESIPWDKYQIDIVIDATGAFEKKEELAKHLRGSVKKVILSQPSDDDSIDHVVLGVNDTSFDFQNQQIISNCSCTTNSASPLFKVLDDTFRVLSAYLTTIHAYTSSQSLLDEANKNFTRSRAAGLNIVPTTTGAAEAVVKTLPNLKGRIDGMAIRIPIPTGSFTDISAIVEKSTTVQEVDAAFKKASQDSLGGILEYMEDPIVSSDIIGSPYSSIFDSNYTKVISGHLVKVFGWYDNEWGYSSRLVDLVEKLSDYV